MPYVVYEIESTRKIATYKHIGHAMRRLHKEMLNYPNDELPRFGMSSLEIYNDFVVHDIEVTNKMSGDKIKIKSNTPYVCRPDNESYWSS